MELFIDIENILALVQYDVNMCCTRHMYIYGLLDGIEFLHFVKCFSLCAAFQMTRSVLSLIE